MKKSIFLKIVLTVVTAAVIFTGCSKDSSKNEPPAGENTPEEAVKQEDNKKDESSDYGIVINEEDVVFTDSSGEEISIAKNPQRVIVFA